MSLLDLPEDLILLALASLGTIAYALLRLARHINPVG